MKQLRLLILIGCILVPLTLYAETFNLTLLLCNGLDCGDVTAPTVPTGLSATSASPSQINLTWTASSDVPGAESFVAGVAGYRIYRDGGLTPVATVSGTSYSDTGLSTSTTYSYAVSAYDLIGNESSASATVSTTTKDDSFGAPVPTNGAPSGTLGAGTTQATLLVTTDISATCRYSSTANTPYASISSTFSTTGGISHSTVVTGLADSTTYTFYIRCKATSGSTMTSDYIISFAVATPSSNSGGGGGGGGGGPIYPSAGVESVVIKGVAYPGSAVTLLKDGQLVSKTTAGPDARFEIKFTNIVDGTFTFNVWAKDVRGVKSNLFPFTVTLTKGVTNVVSGIFLPPTIVLDKKEVRKGDPVTVIGQSAPKSSVTVTFHSEKEYNVSAKADDAGLWSYKFDTSPLEYGDHTAAARSKIVTDISGLSSLLGFKVGTKNVAAVMAIDKMADLNQDGSINLVDFSMMLYWYKRPKPAAGFPPGFDLNNDGKIDLVDFSILAYHWTG